MIRNTLYTLAIAMLLGIAPAYAAQADTYATLDQAATAALIEAEALTDSYEAGGTIYHCSAGYIYVRPTTDHSKDSLSVSIYTLDGCALAGLYHTHPKGDARYSITDINGACGLHTVSFIKPRGGSVRSFDCTSLSHAAIQVAVSGQRPVTGKAI